MFTKQDQIEILKNRIICLEMGHDMLYSDRLAYREYQELKKELKELEDANIRPDREAAILAHDRD